MQGNDYDASRDGDWVTLHTSFSPTHAHVLLGCLHAARVPAALADEHLLQTDLLLASAVPVRLLVPERWLAEGLQVLAAFERGDFALSDDADHG